MKKLIAIVAALTMYATAAQAAQSLDIADESYNCLASITYAKSAGHGTRIRQTIGVNGISIQDFRHYLSKVVTADGYGKVEAKITCKTGSVNVVETVEWIGG